MEFDWLDDDPFSSTGEINPATGLPMIDHSPIDVAGNFYGTDSASTQNFVNPTLSWIS